MPSYSVQPFVGIGPVRLGMSQDEVRKTMPEPAERFRKGPTSRHEADAYHDHALQIYYEGDHPTVEYIELSCGSDVRAVYRNLDIFETPADEVVAYVSIDAEFDQNEPDIPYSYIFPDLQLSLWRPTIPASDTDAEGQYFSTVGIGRKGYYDVT